MRIAEISSCRSCGSTQLAEVLDLGLFSLSDFLTSPEDHADKAPLTLVRCEDCTLVQLRHTVERERLYANYWYRSATQPAMVEALQDIVRDAQDRVSLLPGDLVVDIGANDGTLLAQYPDGVIRGAYEPAMNLWARLIDNDARLLGGFFPPAVKGPFYTGDAKIVTSIACFYDTDDPNAWVAAIKKMLAPDGVWINQMAYLPMTLATNNFGDFCHEHLTYWTAFAFDRLLARHGLEIRQADLNEVNGGSIRFVVGHGDRRAERLDLVEFGGMISQMESGRRRLKAMLRSLHRYGKVVVGYGASTKGNTYLQYWGIPLEHMPLIADRNPDKWGKYTPTGQIVISEDEMRLMKPDYLLVLPWHFLDAFLARESDLLVAGTKWIVPFPELHIVGGEPCPSLVEDSSVNGLA